MNRDAVVHPNPCSEQERATSASLRVAWTLGKNKRLFTDAETVKECMLASIEEVVTDEKTRNSVIDSIKKIPISDMSTSRRVESTRDPCIGCFLDSFGQNQKSGGDVASC